MQNLIEDKVQQDEDYEESALTSSDTDEQEAKDSVHVEVLNSAINVPSSAEKSPMANNATTFA